MQSRWQSRKLGYRSRFSQRSVPTSRRSCSMKNTTPSPTTEPLVREMEAPRQTALTSIQQKIERLLAQGKKVLVQWRPRGQWLTACPELDSLSRLSLPGFTRRTPVRTVNMHEAKTHLSQLVEKAAGGEPFVIAKAGRPMVKVIPLDETATPRRLGFMAGQIRVPDDFDQMGQEAILAMFGEQP